MSVALPMKSFLHFGQTGCFNFDLLKNSLSFIYLHSLHIWFQFDFNHLQSSQIWCPLAQWKILVGGVISSKHTCKQYDFKIFNFFFLREFCNKPDIQVPLVGSLEPPPSALPQLSKFKSEIEKLKTTHSSLPPSPPPGLPSSSSTRSRSH